MTSTTLISISHSNRQAQVWKTYILEAVNGVDTLDIGLGDLLDVRHVDDGLAGDMEGTSGSLLREEDNRRYISFFGPSVDFFSIL